MRNGMLAAGVVAAIGAAGAAAYVSGALGRGDPIEVRYCDELIKQAIQSPASYRRADVIRTPGSIHDSVRIRFDAANRSGTVLRGSAHCLYSAGVTGSHGAPVIAELSIDGRQREDLHVLKALADRAVHGR